MNGCRDVIKYCVFDRLVSANFPPGFFSHLFIDEAGHCVEPEAVIAIAGTLCNLYISIK